MVAVTLEVQLEGTKFNVTFGRRCYQNFTVGGVSSSDKGEGGIWMHEGERKGTPN